MADDKRGFARAVWNGPFYVGPLTRPVSVGDVLLKTLETLWRAVLLVAGALITGGVALYLWVEVLGPNLFPPLETKISTEASFDDGAAPQPPAIGTQEKPFRCTPQFPLKITFTNNSNKTVGRLNFSIEGRPPGHSSNVVENGAWREVDAVIPPGYGWQACWAVSTRDEFSPATLDYAIDVFGATEADAKARLQPATAPPSTPVKASSPRPTSSGVPSPVPSTTVSLATLKDADWQKIGMGCSCSFSVGVPREEKLIAGGDGRTLFRLNGKDHVCPAPDTQTMFDGPVAMSCGSTAVQVTPNGKVEPGFDGHSSKARLNIVSPSGTLTLSGTWGCGC